MVLRHRKSLEVFPDLKLENIWETYTKEPPSGSDEYHKIAYENLQYLDVDTREGILSDLLQIEMDSTRQNDRLRYIRTKIMDLVDRRSCSGNMQQFPKHDEGRHGRVNTSAEKEPEHAMADCDLQIAILRAFARGKYGDGRKDDWYAMYAYLSESFYGRMLTGQTGVSAPRFIFDGQTMEATEENFQTCRKKCIDAYVGQEFDIPTDNSNRLLKLWRKISRKPIWRKLIS